MCWAAFPKTLLAETEEAAPLTGVTINVYNWGEYISDGTDGTIDINAEFTRRTGIQVNYTTYPDNESLYSKLASGGASYDVIIPSDYMISKMIDEGMLEKLDFNNIPNFQYIDEAYRNPLYDPENEYSVPYTWGVVGISTTKIMSLRRRQRAGMCCGTKNMRVKSSCLTIREIHSALHKSCSAFRLIPRMRMNGFRQQTY